MRVAMNNAIKFMRGNHGLLLSPSGLWRHGPEEMHASSFLSACTNQSSLFVFLQTKCLCRKRNSAAARNTMLGGWRDDTGWVDETSVACRGNWLYSHQHPHSSSPVSVTNQDFIGRTLLPQRREGRVSSVLCRGRQAEPTSKAGDGAHPLRAHAGEPVTRTQAGLGMVQRVT